MNCKVLLSMVAGVLASGLFLTNLTVHAAPPPAKPNPVKKPPPPDYYPLRLNDWWQYRTTNSFSQTMDYKVKVIAAEVQPDKTVIYETLTEGLGKYPIHDWYIKAVGQVIRLVEQFGDEAKMQVTYDPPYGFLNNPLKEGDTWDWAGKGMMGVAVTDHGEVGAVEDIEVPAGKFKAVKVVDKVKQGGADVTKTYWYANWVGLVKSTVDAPSMHTGSELVDYSFKPKPKEEAK